MDLISVELRYLLYSVLLMLAIWLPYILVHVRKVGVSKAFSYPDQEPALPPWAQRLKRAHYNLLENLVPFAVVVLAAEVLNVHTTLTAICAMAFFWARVAHPIAMVTRVWGGRSAAFGIGWAATLVYLFAVLTAAN